MNIRLVALISLGLFSGALSAPAQSPVRVGNLTVEHVVNPIGIGATQPRFSWKLQSSRAGEMQTAYELRAASTAAGLAADKADVWDSGKTMSDASVLVPWGGQALGSRAQVFWQVRVWDKDGQPTAWSKPASFELGLLNPATDWKGQWITVDLPRFDIEEAPLTKANWISAGSAANQQAAVRLTLNLPTDVKVRAASVDIAADGLIALYVNGVATKQGGTSHTAPFHSDFGTHLVQGKNIIAISSLAVRNYRGTDGRNAIAAHVIVELENGQRIESNTDGTWKAYAFAPAPPRGSPPVVNPIANTWYSADFDDTAWVASTALNLYEATPASGSADSTVGPGRYLRKTFTVKGPIAKARLYSTALGVYEASINGQRVNDHQLDPGFTTYDKRVMVQTTDVTSLLKPGANAIGALLEDGWFVGRLGWDGLYQYKQVSTHPLFNAQLEITYADGSTDVIATDNSWKGGPGEVVGSDDQLGEVIDDRQTAPWDQASFNDSKWAAATAEDHNTVALDPQLGPPVRRVMELTPKKISQLGGAWIVDFGQDMVGHVRLTAKGPGGDVINVSHAEMLNPDGTIYNENLRSAISLDTFTLKGGASETFEPHFTFHGFRYVEITGYPGNLTADNIRGIVVGSDNPATGTWESSSKDLNQLYSNIEWGQRGNYLSVPTDCPQRDERMGWMGDAQVFAPTAARNSDVAGFFAKWLVDVDDAQNAKGAFSNVSPKGTQNQSYPVWGDAGVIIPWAMYTTYGDKKFLEDHYAAMARWVDYCQATPASMSLGVGDHLAPVLTTTALVDNVYYANSANIVAKAAAILGKTDDAAKYSKLHDDIVAAYQANYIGQDGAVTAAAAGGRAGGRGVGNTQAAYVLALKYDMVPPELRPAVAQRLVDDVVKNGHLTTGFVASGWICPILTQTGHADLAWQLVFTDTYPSWLFQVKSGATTMWERWDGWTPDKGFQDSTMNSFNHYSFGAVGYWFYTGAAGIQLDEASPGYKHFLLQPQFTNRLTYVKASFDSPYGVISSYWHDEDANAVASAPAGSSSLIDQAPAQGETHGMLLYDVTVPPNSSATLTLPIARAQISTHDIVIPPSAGNTTVVNLPAGTYHFAFPKSLVEPPAVAAAP